MHFACFVLPWPARRRCLQALFGYELHPTCFVGYSVVDVASCVMEAESRIGHFNIIRNLDQLRLEQDSGIGTLNYVTGFPSSRKGSFEHLHNRECSLTLKRMAGITSRHFVDCTGSVLIGTRSTVAGIRSTILTHSIDVVRNRQDAAPVRIGEGCFLGSNIVVLPGVEISSNCVVAAGTVVNRSLQTRAALYAGNPATMKRKIDEEGTLYFSREKSNVS